MEASISAPLLKQVKSWQLFCFGISGWVTLYSAAIISWGASSFIVGNAQGGSFAVVMTLAGREVRRLQKGSSDLLQWAGGVTTEQLNLALTITLQKNELILEALHPNEAEMGFGLRAVKAGRTFLFETARWKESVIDLLHAKTTEENRNKTNADFAIIVGAGTPDEDTKIFVNNHPVKLLVGKELKNLFAEEKSPVNHIETMSILASGVGQPGSPRDMAVPSSQTGCDNNSAVKKVKPLTPVAKSSNNRPIPSFRIRRG
jgi:hypothetical protein